MRLLNYALIGVLLLCGCRPEPEACGQGRRKVDEPLGARYSLGGTLWHLGHQADSIRSFHAFVRERGLTPSDFLPPEALQAPASLQAILVEPEGLPNEQLNGWKVSGDWIASGATDRGPTVSIPLSIPQAGFYRLWIGYEAWPNARGVTSVRIYKTGEESLGPIVQPDEFYDQPPETAGPAWKDMLVDLPAGDLTVKLGHVTRWWHGGGRYARRRVDCLYVTDRLWADPPDHETRARWRDSAPPDGIQWNLSRPLPPEEVASWQWWRLRPLSWEQAATQPQQFALSREFHRLRIESLAEREYEEAHKPDYRAPERQVIFDETWNMLANPVRIRRQVKALQTDVARQPLPYRYYWHDVGSHIEGQRDDGSFDPDGPSAGHGSWSAKPGVLQAGYGNARGTVRTRLAVDRPGRYHLWVRSHRVNLSYTAPWFGKVSLGDEEQFTYHHQGKISNLWTRMGAFTLEQPGEVRIDFTLDGAGRGGTYRRIHTLFLVDDETFVPRGTLRPPWTMEQYRAKARRLGAGSGDTLLPWLFEDPYVPLSQEVWADKTTRGQSWPSEGRTNAGLARNLYLPREACHAVKLALRNLKDEPIALEVELDALHGRPGRFDRSLNWRVVAFAPDGHEKQTTTSRQNWHPFVLLRRPAISVPPLNVAGVWITVDTRGVPAGNYEGKVTLREPSGKRHQVALNVTVSPVAPAPERPVLIDGFTQPPEGEAYFQDFVEHGMNVWKGLMSREEMQRRGIRLLRLSYGSTNGIPEWYEKIQNLGLKRDDYFVGIKDEPGGKTAEALRPFIDVARALKRDAPEARVSFNPSEGASLETFEVLAPYCDFWIPYSKHVFAPHWGNPKKWEIFHPKPWMWYTTPCLYDKTVRDPGIRRMPSQPGNCVGVAFFALNYPWRDPWDAGYEQIRDASAMGALVSRHGPVPTIVWENIREAAQTANLAMMVRERLGADRFDDIQDEEMRRLVREGGMTELLRWLETHRSPIP